jgi:hypothetical protein
MKVFTQIKPQRTLDEAEIRKNNCCRHCDHRQDLGFQTDHTHPRRGQTGKGIQPPQREAELDRELSKPAGMGFAQNPIIA